MPWAQEDSAARERILAAARREAMRRASLTDSSSTAQIPAQTVFWYNTAMSKRIINLICSFALTVALGGLSAQGAYTVQGCYTLAGSESRVDASVVRATSGTHLEASDQTVAYLMNNSTAEVTFKATPKAGWHLVGWTLWNTRTKRSYAYSNASSHTLTLADFDNRMDERAVSHFIANFRWMNYTLSYDANGGQWAGNAAPGQTDLIYTNQVTALAASRCVRTGYHVASWNTQKDGKGISIACGATGVTGATLGVEQDAADIRLYAQWAADIVTVTLSAEEAENTPTTSVRATYDAEMPSLAVLPTRTGYTFDGYYTARNGGGRCYYKADGTSNQTCDLTEATTLYANWVVKTYTVSFLVDGNGTVNPSGSHTYAYGDRVNVSAMPATGSVFVGWNDGEMSASRTITVTGDATYTASFTLSDCTVTFVYYDGRHVLTNDVRIYSYGAKVEVPTDVDNRFGYRFVSWSPTVSSMVRGDATYVAQYEALRYYIVFDGNGATGGQTQPQEFLYSETKALSQNRFTRTGYTFLGWSEKADAVTADYADREEVGGLLAEGALTLYAVWEANKYTVVFDGNGATGGTMESQTFKYDEEQALSANLFTRPTQVFVCWRMDDGRTFADGAVVKNLAESGSVTLHAQWSGYHYVDFDGNGASSGTMAQQRFDGNEAQALTPNAYAKTGYTFGGWATNETDAASLLPRYADKEVVSIAAPMDATNTLYAVWMTNHYSIVFKPGAANVLGTMEPLACTYDVASDLPTCTYENYASAGFLGWARTEGGDVVYADGDTVSNLTAEPDGTVTLYAVWDGVGELSEAVGLDNAVLRNTSMFSGRAWSVANDFGRTDGSCAMCANAPGGSKYATMDVTVVGPGKLSFYWCRANNKESYNLFKVETNGVVVANCQPPKKSDGWEKVELVLGAGLQTVTWASGSSARDEPGVLQCPLYVDDVRWEPKSATEEEFEYTDAAGAAHTVSVPHAWVKDFYSAEEIEAAGGYRALLEASSGKAGWAVPRWQEYIAGTNPKDADSVFHLTAIEVKDGAVSLSWSPDLRKDNPPRIYTVFGKAALEDAAWQSVDYSRHRFFKVEVHLP